MKKHLIAVLLTACLLFSFGTTAFAEQADNEATGWFGYYLSNENATWGTANWENELRSYVDEETHKTKYKELNNPVKKGGTTQVTMMEPVLDGHTFLGWGDKKRDGNEAAIRREKETLTYCYENGKPYTLDALWGSLSIEGGEKVYDGKPFTLKAATFALNNEGLSSQYAQQYTRLLTVGDDIEYSTDNQPWTKDLSEIQFVDAHEYVLYARQTVKVEFSDGTSEVREIVGHATYNITPRPVTLTSASDTKVYDGEALTNDTVTATVTAEGKGFVEGQGVTITVTGTQTEVGSSDNTFTYEPKDNNTNLSNYEIKPIYGTLTVTEKTTPDPVDPKSNPDTTPTPTPTPVVTPAPTAAPSTDDTTPENTATTAPTATAAPTATPAPAPTAAPAAARAATTIPQTGDNFPAVALVIVMLAAIVGLGITVVLRTDKKK